MNGTYHSHESMLQLSSPFMALMNGTKRILTASIQALVGTPREALSSSGMASFWHGHRRTVVYSGN